MQRVEVGILGEVFGAAGVWDLWPTIAVAETIREKGRVIDSNRER